MSDHIIDNQEIAGDKAFNWQQEFPQIFAKGGFDVVIGNPPYVAMTKIGYGIICDNFTTADLYGYVINRAFSILNSKGRHGFIVMHNLNLK